MNKTLIQDYPNSIDCFAGIIIDTHKGIFTAQNAVTGHMMSISQEEAQIKN